MPNSGFDRGPAGPRPYPVAVVAAALCIAATLIGVPVKAQGKDTTTAARELAVEGRVAYTAGDFERARDLFHRAYAMVGAPTISVYEARCLVRLGRLTEGAALYRRTLATVVDPRAPDQFHRALSDAARELSELTPRLAGLGLVLLHAPAAGEPRIAIDGAPMDAAQIDAEKALDPGAHRIDVSSGDGALRRIDVTLAEGEHRRIELDLGEPAPPRRVAAPAPRPVAAPDHHRGAPSTLRTLAFVSLGAGAVGIGTGLIAGLSAAGKHTDALRACPQNRCVEGGEGVRDVDAFRTLSTVSTIGYVAGGVFAAGGVTLLLVSPPRSREHDSARVELFVEPRLAGVRGSFR